MTCSSTFRNRWPAWLSCGSTRRALCGSARAGSRARWNPRSPSRSTATRSAICARASWRRPGTLRLRERLLCLRTPGLPIRRSPGAVAHPIAELPHEVLRFLLQQPVLRGGQPRRPAAFDLFSNTTPGWERVQAICNYVHAKVAFGYAIRAPHQDRPRRVHRAPGRVPRLSSIWPSRFAGRWAFPRATPPAIWATSAFPINGHAHGFQRVVRGVSGESLVDRRCSPQSCRGSGAS
jgi:hypothetical protein